MIAGALTALVVAARRLAARGGGHDPATARHARQAAIRQEMDRHPVERPGWAPLWRPPLV